MTDRTARAAPPERSGSRGRSLSPPPGDRPHIHDRAARRYDPTGLGVARRRWELEVRRRFGELRRAVKHAVITLDVLGLKGPSVEAMMFERLFTSRITRDAITPPAKEQFAFQRSAAKVQSFSEWLRQAAREGILEVTAGTPLTMAANASWQNTYIDAAYQKGIRDAHRRMGEPVPQGAFNRPIHADSAGLIYTRAYRALEGVTDVMDAQMSGVLAQSIVEGRGAVATANALSDRVDAIGEVRARTIARTELTAAYSEASLNSYAEAGVEGVRVEVELATAGDDVVCEECEELEGNEYSLDEARGLLPVHPNCRCALIPTLPDDELAEEIDEE